MHTEREPIDPNVLAEMGYERRDVNIPAVRKWTIGFFVLTFLFFAMGYIFYRWLAPVTFARAASGKPPVTRRIPPAPNPLLQDNVGSKLDIMQLRQEEEQAMGTYGWANKERTAVRIPIERAMDLIVRRGANAVPSAPAEGTAPRPPAGSSQPTVGGGNASGEVGATGPGDTAPSSPIPSQGKSPSENPAQPPAATPTRSPEEGSNLPPRGSAGAPAGTNSASN